MMKKLNSDEPMRIAHIMGKWLGGGVESVVMNYYRNIDRTKIQFDFICDNDSTDIPYDEIKKLGGNVYLVPPYQKPLKYQRELQKLFGRKSYHIVHSHINTLSFFSLRAAKKTGVPIRIAHSHSTSNEKEFFKNLLKNILKPLSRVYANQYMCCSEFAGRWLFGNKLYDSGAIYQLNNAIDLKKYKYDKTKRINKRKKMKIQKSTLVIGHIGRFVDQKNHSFLIDIFNEIRKKKRDSVLILVGQGPSMNRVKEKVHALKLDNYVRFLGQRNDVNELYQAFDVFLLPSLYEGLPVVGIEAQASGVQCYLSEEISKEAKIIESTTFISLNNTAKEWSDIIIENQNKFKRHNVEEEISRKGYDIKREAKKLEKLYSKLDKNKGETK